LFLPVPIKMLLTANGYIVSRSEQMVLLTYKARLVAKGYK
jgi:hypothetical protein